jgi:hypothetical protein
LSFAGHHLRPDLPVAREGAKEFHFETLKRRRLGAREDEFGIQIGGLRASSGLITASRGLRCSHGDRGFPEQDRVNDRGHQGHFCQLAARLWRRYEQLVSLAERPARLLPKDIFSMRPGRLPPGSSNKRFRSRLRFARTI